MSRTTYNRHGGAAKIHIKGRLRVVQTHLPHEPSCCHVERHKFMKNALVLRVYFHLFYFTISELLKSKFQSDKKRFYLG